MFSQPVPDISLGRLVPPRGDIRCGYASSERDRTCRARAIWHVMLRMRGSRAIAILLCGEHMDLVDRNNVYADRHHAAVVCDMPGWAWQRGNPSFCAVPGVRAQDEGEESRRLHDAVPVGACA